MTRHVLRLFDVFLRTGSSEHVTAQLHAAVTAAHLGLPEDVRFQVSQAQVLAALGGRFDEAFALLGFAPFDLPLFHQLPAAFAEIPHERTDRFRALRGFDLGIVEALYSLQPVHRVQGCHVRAVSHVPKSRVNEMAYFLRSNTNCVKA